MAKENLKPMPELKDIIYPAKPEDAEGTQLSRLKAISERYSRAIEKAGDMQVRLGIDSSSGQQLVPERTAQKEIQEAIQGIKIPENLTGKAMLDAALEIGVKRKQAKEQAIRNKTVDTETRLQTKSIPELQQKKAIVNYLIETEEKYEGIQSFNSGIYTEEELKDLKQERDAAILPLVTFESKVPEEKPEQPVEPEGPKLVKEAEEIAPATASPEQPVQEEAEVEMPSFTNLSTLEKVAAEALKTGLREKRTVSGSELIEKIWGTEIDKKNGKERLNSFMPRLRNKIAKQQTEWDIINTTFEQRRSRVEGQYKFEKKEKPSPSVPSTKEQTTKVKKPKGTRKTETKNTQERKNKFPEVTESRRKALESIIENPDLTLQEVKDILGSSKRGKPLTWMQALYALTRASNILYIRIDKKIERFYEFSLWNRIRSYVNNGISYIKEDKKAILNSFKEKLKAWFEAKKSEAPKEEIIQEQPVEEAEELTPLSDQETMVLSGIVGLHEAQIDEDTLQVCRNFVYGMFKLDSEFADKLTIEEYKKLRTKILKTISKMGNNRRQEIIDMQNTDAEIILIGLCCSDENKIPQILDYMSSVQNGDQEQEMRSVITIWKNWEALVDALNTKEVKEIQQAKEPEITIFTNGQEKTGKTPICPFEKENPDIRDVVNDFLDQVDGKESLFPITGSTLGTMVKPTVTKSMTEQLERYIYPITKNKRDKYRGKGASTRNPHPRYSLEDSAVLFCLRGRSNITHKKVKELRKIIAEQYALWQKEKEGNNGKSVNGNGKNGNGK